MHVSGEGDDPAGALAEPGELLADGLEVLGVLGDRVAEFAVHLGANLLELGFGGLA